MPSVARTWAGGARLIVVLLQVHHAHQSSAELSVVQGALYIDHGLGQKGEAILPEVVGHGVVHIHDVCLHVRTVQTALRQDEPQG